MMEQYKKPEVIEMVAVAMEGCKQGTCNGQ